MVLQASWSVFPSPQVQDPDGLSPCLAITVYVLDSAVDCGDTSLFPFCEGLVV